MTVFKRLELKKKLRSKNQGAYHFGSLDFKPKSILSIVFFNLRPCSFNFKMMKNIKTKFVIQVYVYVYVLNTTRINYYLHMKNRINLSQ